MKRSKEEDDAYADAMGSSRRKQRAPRGQQPNIAALLPLLASSSNSKEQKRAAMTLRDMSEKLSARKAIVDGGAVKPLVALLECDSGSSVGKGVASGVHRNCQEYAAEALANISASEGLEQPLVDAGILPPMVALLSSDHISCKVYAAFTIANLVAADDDSLAREAVNSGAMPPMVLLLSATDVRLQRYASATVFNISAAEGFGELLLHLGIVEPLLPLLKQDYDPECKEYASGTIGNLALNPDFKERIEEAGHMAMLNSLLGGAGLGAD
jgi:vacuolar protein 8